MYYYFYFLFTIIIIYLLYCHDKKKSFAKWTNIYFLFFLFFSKWTNSLFTQAPVQIHNISTPILKF